jgi:transposase
MRKVALDLGARKTAYCEVQNGQVIQRATVTSLETLESLLGPRHHAAEVAIEACREAWHVHDLLSSWGNHVVLVDTTRSRRLGIGQHGRKTDKIDAEVLALALERGGIPVAHVLSPHRRELRRYLNVRRALVESRAQLVTTARGLAREQGATVPKCAIGNFVRHARKLAPQLLGVIEPLLKLLETVNAELEVVDAKLAELCETEPVVKLLMTAPGVGPTIAASFVSVVDDAKRFHSSHQVESYLGLVPSEDSSGGRRRLGAISKKGNSYLRSLLVQGAWSILRKIDRKDPLRLWADAVAERRGKKIAVIALARRLAGVLWAMWRDNAPYNAAFLASASSRGTRKSAHELEIQAAKLSATARKRVPAEATLQT